MKIGYIRVSKHEQNEALQRDALKEAGCEKYFSDVITGSKFERKGLEQLLAFARSGDTVIVWKLDRLGRSLKDLIETLNLLKDQGVDFIALTEHIDTTTPGGKLIFHLFLLVIVHFPQKSRIDAWIPSVFNIQKQPQRIMSRVKERRLSFHMGEA